MEKLLKSPISDHLRKKKKNLQSHTLVTSCCENGDDLWRMTPSVGH